MWTKPACVVLAWSILLILAAVGMKGSVRPVQANIRIAGSTEFALTRALSIGTPFVTAAAGVEGPQWRAEADALARHGLPDAPG